MVEFAQAVKEVKAVKEFRIPPPPPAGAGYLRAAAVQLDFQAAAVCEHIHLLEQPPLSTTAVTWPDWFAIKHLSRLTSLSEWRKTLGRVLRRIYCEYQARRVAAILRVCRGWGVQVVVFPEYSIPPDCLEALVPETQGMVVVFGTHAVEQRNLREGLYARLGGNAPEPGTAIAPVAVDGTLRFTQPKLNKTKLELDLRLGTVWDPIKLDSPLSVHLGVMICLDFLHRDGDPSRVHVGAKISACDLLAVPSLTPWHTVGEFTARSMSESKRYGRPIVYANIADGGGTTIFVDSARDKPDAEFPYGIAELARYEEGVVVSDIDLARSSPDEKPSTLFSDRTATVPVAAALLQYQSTKEDLDVGGVLEQVFGGCDLSSCSSMAQAVLANEGLLRGLAKRSTSTLQLRLNMLLDRYDQFSQPEEFLRLLRDLPLSEDIDTSAETDDIRLEVAEEMARAYATSTDDLEAMASIRRRLSEQPRGGRGIRKTSTAAALRRRASVVELYKPRVHEPRMAPGIGEASGLELAAVSLCRDELGRARAAFESNRWGEAQRLYAEVQGVAARIVGSGSNSADAWAVYTSGLLGQIASYLNLQEIDKATALVAVVDEGRLDTKQRTVLSRALVELNDATRSRRILDAVAEEGRGTEHWREASALVEFALGNSPEGFERVPPLLYAKARHSLLRGEVATAAAAAIEGLAKKPGNAILVASLLSAAMVALMRTLFEDDVADGGVQVADRPLYANSIAAEFKALFLQEMPPSVRANLLEVALNYAGSLKERDLFRWIVANSDRDERDKGQSNEVRLAFESAERGELTKALELAPRQKHPWRVELMRAQLLRVAGDQDGALESLNGLATTWPGRVPIHNSLAELLMDRRRFELALTHAEIAYRGLATPSMGIALARCLVETEKGLRALEILEGVETTDQVLELRAYAADQSNDPLATMYWSQIAARDADDTNARVRLAAALVRSGDIEEAARHSRALLETHIDVLALDQLAICGQMLSMARFLPTSDALIQRAAEALRVRFPTDDRAEMLRLTLLTTLGFPSESVPIDYERLAQAGHLKSVSIDDAATFMRERSALVGAAHRLYQEGWIDTETLCQFTGTRTASLVVRWTRAASMGRTVLRAAVVPGLASEAEVVRDRHFLCTSIELLLLHRSGSLAHVPPALGAGSLVALETTWERFVDDAYYLEQSTQRSELSRLRNLLAMVAGSTKLHRVSADVSENELAANLGLVLVTLQPSKSPGGDARALVRGLMEAGAISRPQFEHANKYLGGEDARVGSLASSKGFLLGDGLLELFDAAGILAVLLSVSPSVAVFEAAVVGIRQRLDELETYEEAARLQREVVEFLGAGRRAGWFRLAKPPVVSSLPAPREDVDRDQATVLTQSIRHQALLKELLNQNASWTRIAADSFGFDSIGHPQQWRLLGFTDAEHGQAYFKNYWRPGKREITLSRFARSVVKPGNRSEVMRALAQLGFADALLTDDVVALAKDYGRVDTGRAAQILGGMESSAGGAESRGVFARIQLSLVYATAIWKLAKQRGEQSDPEFEQQLLTRLEELDRASSSRLVEQTLCNVVLAAVDDRRVSFVEEQPGSSTMLLMPSSVAGQLWSRLARWEADSLQRRAAFRRGLAIAWQQIGQLKDEKLGSAQWAPLALATNMLGKEEAFDAPIPSPDAVVAVMSGLWEARPLTGKTVTFTADGDSVEVDLETLLNLAASVVSNEKEGSWRIDDENTMTFRYAPNGGQRTAEVSVPIEAVILRMEGSLAAKLAKTLAIAIGSFDGRLYRALTEFSKSPRNRSRRKQLARAACGAPLRLVADDPQFVMCLGDRAGVAPHMYPATIGDLREFLSEPPDLEGVDARTLPSRFFQRFEHGGAWAERDDKYQLMEIASRVPGPLPAAAARSMFNQQSVDDLTEIDRALRQSQTMPVGTLAMATAFSMMSICKESPNEGAPDMAPAFVAMLEKEFSTQSLDEGLAVRERAALEAIGRVVSRMAPWGIPIVDHAWLTTRLYECWSRKVEGKDLSFLARSDSSSWQRLRAEIVLNVVLDVLEATVVTEGRVPSLPQVVLEAVREVATRTVVNPFEAAERPAWIYWDRPQGCEWLAAGILLWGDPNAFFELGPELRLSILEKLPRAVDATKNLAISFEPVFRALSRNAERFTDPEMSELRKWLRETESGGLADLWRAQLLNGIFESRGDESAAAGLRQLVGADSLRLARSEVVGGYLEAASSPVNAANGSGDVERGVVELLEAVSVMCDGVVRIGDGIALVLARPHQERVRALLESLLQRHALSKAVRGVVGSAVAN